MLVVVGNKGWRNGTYDKNTTAIAKYHGLSAVVFLVCIGVQSSALFVLIKVVFFLGFLNRFKVPEIA